MFDDFSKRNKAVRAALEIAAEQGWRGVTFPAIAERSHLSLGELRSNFTSKSDLLKAFQAEVDAEVLSKVKPSTPEQTPRDRLLDLIMTRFETMGPYKPALKRIAADLACRPAEQAQLICSTLASQYWMLAGAGAKLDRPGAGLRVAGLAAIYAKTFRVWLGDDTPGLERTMAALDRSLRKGEDWLSGVESACCTVGNLICGLMPRGWKRRTGSEPAGEPAPSSGAA
jgi:AcrR family transcriptional regulator